MTIRKLLVANRGEIAIRIFRTCQELGIRTVAVFSEADRNALHAQIADEAVEIGPSEAAHSYLAVDRVMEAALKTGVDAIHPGYGFLSERPELPEACGNNGIVFVGPSAAAMRKIGDKISAKQLAVQVGTPIVPGFFSPGATLEQLEEAAERVGYPVMLKASAGGGGRGMRVVRDRNSLPAEFRFAVQEALNAFGEGSMMLEKLVLRPRHVEVQVAADRHGAVACLFERECSLQRRNQKMLEEAPALSVEGGLVDWGHLREAASKLVSSAGYENLGTVEFIVDPTSGEFYFMEVNARLQVEHPVTEAITGLDLVALQLRIAVGEPLICPKS